MGRTVVLVAIVLQLLPLPLILLGAPQLPCNGNEPRASATAESRRNNTPVRLERSAQYGAEVWSWRTLGPTVKIHTGLLRLLVFFDGLLHGFPLLLESFT